MMAYNIITAPLWPAYTDAFARGDYVWMKKMRSKMQKILFLSVLGCFMLVVLSPLIYKIWIGNKVSIPLEMTLLVGFYVSAYCWMTLNGTFIVGMGKIKIETIIVIIGMILHIPASLFFGKYIGAYGVVVSLFVINLFYAIVMNFQVDMLLNKTAQGIWNK